jgi:hypothetical protein
MPTKTECTQIIQLCMSERLIAETDRSVQNGGSAAVIENSAPLAVLPPAEQAVRAGLEDRQRGDIVPLQESRARAPEGERRGGRYEALIGRGRGTRRRHLSRGRPGQRYPEQMMTLVEH